MSPEEQYREYLKRYTRTTGRSLEDASRDLICKEVGLEYGLSEIELEEITERLVAKKS